MESNQKPQPATATHVLLAGYEESRVRELGDQIGYGRMMQLAERIWGEKLEAQGLPPGGAHAAYCCASFLVPCPCCVPPYTRGEDGCACQGGASGLSCDWCCGAGRVTRKVAEAIERQALAELGELAREMRNG